MLIRDAELDFGRRRADVRVVAGRVAEIAPGLSPRPGEAVIAAQGCALLPSLHDHHLHLYAAAAAQDSVDCRPAVCPDLTALEAALRAADAALPPGRWLRGVGWHDRPDSPTLSRAELDRWLPQRPLRLQHRSGRLWWLNGAALRALGVSDDGDDPCERIAGRCTGRLLDADDWLRARLPRQPPDLGQLSERLWRWGVTAVTDTGYRNGLDEAEALAAARACGVLRQTVRVMGTAELDHWTGRDGVTRGEYKLHLHDHALPDFEAFCADLRARRAAGRGLAFHCVSRVDLSFALAALAEIGARPGDRIEHASVMPPELLTQIAERRLTVVTQPALLAERGDDYRREVDADDQPWLYRLRSVLDAGVPLAGSSDAPYTDPNPWRAMAAAVTRQTASALVLGADEALSPEQAYQLYTAPLACPGREHRRIVVGADAEWLLLDRPWAAAASNLAAVTVQVVGRADALPPSP